MLVLPLLRGPRSRILGGPEAPPVEFVVGEVEEREAMGEEGDESTSRERTSLRDGRFYSAIIVPSPTARILNQMVS